MFYSNNEALTTLDANLGGMRIIGCANPTAVTGYASSAALVADVVFKESVDTNYIILPVLQTGVPAGAVSIVNKTATGFRIRIDAPVGTFTQGDRRDVSWVMFGY